MLVGAVTAWLGPSDHLVDGRLVVPSAWDRALWGAAASLLAFALLFLSVFTIELLRAPYQQRNAVRATLKAQRTTHIAELSERAAELDHFRELPVSDAHFAELKNLIAGTRAAISGNHKTLTGSERLSVVGHFPHLAQPFDDWDAAIERIYDWSAELEARLRVEAATQGVTEPGFDVDAILPLLLRVIRGRADGEQPALAFELRFFQQGAPDGQYHPGVWIDGVNSVAIDLEKAQLTAAQAAERLNGLLAASQAWPETHAYADRDRVAGWVELKEPLVTRLDELLQRHNYKQGNGCPRCN